LQLVPSAATTARDERCQPEENEQDQANFDYQHECVVIGGWKRRLESIFDRASLCSSCHHDDGATSVLYYENSI